MKIKRLLSVVLLLCMVASMFSMYTFGVGAAAADVDYKFYEENGIKVIANWGQRGEPATFLTSYAERFYGEYTYEVLSGIDGGKDAASAPESALYSKLADLMTASHTHITDYQETRYLYRYTDCIGGDTSMFSSFYSEEVGNGTWDAGATWNREHVWPKSKCLNTDKVDDSADIMMLRPTLISENSSRGNTAFGESAGYFEPADNVKGDCARIALYGYTRWGNTGKMWGTDGMIESVEVLLSWMELDPVDTWEMGRNDSVQSITGTRNVFVDYPEYAWALFGEEIPEGLLTPSAKDGDTVSPDDGAVVAPTPDGGNDNVKPEAPDGNPPSEDETVTLGEAYKAVITLGNDTLFMMGHPENEAYPWYIALSESKEEGVDLYLEPADEAEGGVRFYFINDGVKTYVRAYERDAAKGSGSMELTTEHPAEYYVFDETLGVYTVKGEGGSYYLGTYMTTDGAIYMTVRCSNTKFIQDTSTIGKTQFPLEFIPASQLEDAPLPDDGGSAGDGVVTDPDNTDTDVPSTGGTDGDYKIDSTTYIAGVATPNGAYYMLGTPAAESTPWYIGITTAARDGVKLHLEYDAKDPNAVRIFFYNGNIKTYIRAYERDAAKGSGSIELVEGVRPAETYYFDQELGTYALKGAGGVYYLGTRIGDNGQMYMSIACYNSKYVTGENAYKVGDTQFILQFIPAGEELELPSNGGTSGENKPVDTKPVETKPVETKPIETKPIIPSTPNMPSIDAALKAVIKLPNGVYYMLGAPADPAKPWYINISDIKDDGINIYVEKVDGVADAFRLYFMDGKTKVYIHAHERADAIGSGTIDLTTSVPKDFYTYSQQYKTFVVEGEGGTYYLGTRMDANGKPYMNISCSNTKFLSDASAIGKTQFVVEFVPVGTVELPSGTVTLPNGNGDIEIPGGNIDIPDDIGDVTIPSNINLGGCSSILGGGTGFILALCVAAFVVIKKKK